MLKLRCIERKEKGKTGNARGPERAIANFLFSVMPENADLVSRRGFRCHDMILKPSA